ncbi:hypothetical protein [Psychromonas aquimarina]|uniref:hypothetical protein n=1 Tax=Psychromonas aquimarina TaxID=444919 RepID=UPI0012F7AA2A|nr:hypothetical protein [Psychromonas aquimarina]
MYHLFSFILISLFSNTVYSIGIEDYRGVMSHRYGTLLVAYYADTALQLQEPYYLAPSYIEHSTWYPILIKGGYIALYNRSKKLCLEDKGNIAYASSCYVNKLDHYSFRRIPSIEGSFLLQFKDTNRCLFAQWNGSYYYPFIKTCPELNKDVDVAFLWSFVPKVGSSYAAEPKK